ncbi:MAG TPA: hypothetical protein VI356_00680 [Myxococcales bacterium]
MSAFPGSPRLLRAGIVQVDPDTLAVRAVIALQYNPDSLTRTLQVRGVAGEGGDRLDALRLTGPPAETIKLDAEIDAVDQLEHPESNPNAVRFGIHPLLAALETLVYPSSAQIKADDALARRGTIEIAPMQAPLALFVWSPFRVLPIHLTEFSITEEAFDPQLNPIRAKVTLGFRVLTVLDLPFDHKGTGLFLAYQQQKERFAGLGSGSAVTPLGISRIG